MSAQPKKYTDCTSCRGEMGSTFKLPGWKRGYHYIVGTDGHTWNMDGNNAGTHGVIR